MTGSTGVGTTARRFAGFVVPLVVLAAALVFVDPALLGGAALALCVTFGLVFAYARYVDFDRPDGRLRPADDPGVGRPRGLRASDEPEDRDRDRDRDRSRSRSRSRSWD
jgi:hypothetical protein